MRASVAIAGAGPVGLTLALRLADLGVDSVVLEACGRLRGEGSKALCMQRETLESWARLGIGQQVADRGVAWTLGRTYYRGHEVFQTRFPGVGRDHFPPFVNVSQTEVERLLVERCEASTRVALRWEHEVVGLEATADGVLLESQTASGVSTAEARYAVGADGSRSTTRRLAGIDFPGHSHADQFLIADVRAALPFPSERRFFFDPPWNPGRTVLVHPQPDSVWRIDWQVPSDFDLAQERASGRLDMRIRKIVGDADYEIVWLTAYRFHQRLASRFRADRVFLAGDAAHLMSPFGARGLNSGVSDAENLAWKLARVIGGSAPDALLDSYETERRAAAVENLRVTDETMRFMVPPGWTRLLVRNAVLHLSRWWPRARRLVNSGRLAQPHVYSASQIVEQPPGSAPGEVGPLCGSVVLDGPCTVLAGAPGRDVSRLRELLGDGFVAIVFAASAEQVADFAGAAARVLRPGDLRLVCVVPAGSAPPDVVGGDALTLTDDEGVLAAAYLPEGRPPDCAGRLFLVRPDHHIAARRDLRTPSDIDVLVWLLRFACGERVGSVG